MRRALPCHAVLPCLPLLLLAAAPRQDPVSPGGSSSSSRRLGDPLEPLDLERGATGLALALRHVGTSGRVLCVTAHPDDEPNGALVRLSRGLGLRTALLTLTRGEGGQNLIGPELFQALGVLRTAELMSLHRYDGVEQYFGRAYEFGYSFSVEETLAKWGRDETLGDLVRVVRVFRPDVILTLPTEGQGGGQHHQAVGRLALEAFRVAADRARYPEQLREGLQPWQTRKIYAGAVGGEGEPMSAARVRMSTGVFDPMLGATWQQLGSRARAMHRCQGASQLVADAGPAGGDFVLLDADPSPAAPERDLLDGIDTSLRGLARFVPQGGPIAGPLAELQDKADRARAAFDPLALDKPLAPLAETLHALRALRSGLAALVPQADASREVADRLDEEESDVTEALTLAQGLEIEARADDGLVTPGETFGVAVALWNHGPTRVEIDDAALELASGWKAARQGGGPQGPLVAAGARSFRFSVTTAPEARTSQPYWTRLPDRDRNALLVASDDTLPWSPPDVVARVRCRIAGAEVILRTPAVFRYPGPVAGGEKRHAVQVVPALAVRVSPEIVPLAVAKAAARRTIELRAFVRSETAGLGGELRVEAPRGWSVRPSSVPLHFDYEGEEAAARFEAAPPLAVEPGLATLRVVATSGGREYRETLQVIEYPHIERRQLVRPAETRVLGLEVRTAPGIRVGYVMGSGDAIADAIRGLGVGVTLLSAEDLAFSDLSRFTTIVTGIRAYETRPDLRAAHGRLMRWVEGGGHLVVQYNRAAFNRISPAAVEGAGDAPSPFAPYPGGVRSERISDETAPIRARVPGHVLLTTPNRIGPQDWSGWVQERGIQLFAARDPRYQDLLAASDPFPYNPGEKRGLLVDAHVGAGTWTYVGLVLFRQVPAGVPGGFRILANLISRPRGTWGQGRPSGPKREPARPDLTRRIEPDRGGPQKGARAGRVGIGRGRPS